MSADGGQQRRKHRDDEIDDRLPDAFLILVHNLISLEFARLSKTTDYTDFTDYLSCSMNHLILYYTDS